LFQRPALLAAILVCVSSEAVYEMRVGLSMGGVEQSIPPSKHILLPMIGNHRFAA
jgi:hypothetical protein